MKRGRGGRRVLVTAVFLAMLAVGLPAPLLARVDVPDAETLAPLHYDFRRKGPAIKREDRWEELTRGVNLALGKPYRFDRQPNYGVTRDEGDVWQLTDGKLVPGDKIWFSKEAVGYQGADPPATICIDLGQVYPIDAVVARVQGGGAWEGSFRYPLQFDVYVSDDDRTYTRVDSVRKREYRDQRGALFDLPESTGAQPPGNPLPHPFHFGRLRTRGRYVALRMTLASAYGALDEIAVMKGDHDPAKVTFDPQQATTLLFDAVELLYPRDRMRVPTNVAGGFSFAVRDSRRDTRQPVTFHIDVPAAVTLSWSGSASLRSQEHARDGRPYREYTLTTVPSSGGLSYFYIQARPGALGPMYFYAEHEGVRQPEQRVELTPFEIPPAPALNRLVFAHGWTGTPLQSGWPGGAKALRHFGFTHASVGSWEMPSFYGTPEFAESQKWLDQEARPAGLKVCLTDSPFHIMEALWAQEPDFAEAYGETDPPGKRLCLSYRGKYYQKEIERIVERYRRRQPDLISLDVECFGHALEHVQKCAPCRKLLDDRGVTPEELATDLYAETARELAAAIAQAARDLGQTPPPIGFYHASPAYRYQNVFDFAKLYPAGCQFNNPEVYVRCWPAAAAEIIRADKRLLPPECPIIAWTSPGTLDWEGEAPSGRLFDTLMEELLNGATGTLYFLPVHLCSEDLAAQAQVARLLAPFEEIIATSTLCDTKEWRQGSTGHVSAIRSGDEMLVLLADYEHLGKTTVEARIPVERPVDAVELFTGKRTRLAPGANLLRVTIEGGYRSRPFYIGNRWRERVARR
ncbi:MAG TPA: discoidin domain-containing protein [Armatimonadota bacterium]|nr:discoidin domain-containing protein [Armatimonadota bacterium]